MSSRNSGGGSEPSLPRPWGLRHRAGLGCRCASAIDARAMTPWLQGLGRTGALTVGEAALTPLAVGPGLQMCPIYS